MIKLGKALLNEPVLFFTAVATGLTTALVVVVDPPTWLTIGAPITTAVGGVVTRHFTSPA